MVLAGMATIPLVCCLSCGTDKSSKTMSVEDNNRSPQEIFYADPTVFVENNKFYPEQEIASLLDLRFLSPKT